VDMSESNEDQTFPAVYDDPTQWLPKEVLEANDESSTIAFTRFGERVPTANMSAPGQGGGAFTDFMGDSSAIENSYNPFGFSTALMEQQTAQTNVRERRSKAPALDPRVMILFAHIQSMAAQN
jgi:hypothetical protein